MRRILALLALCPLLAAPQCGHGGGGADVVVRFDPIELSAPAGTLVTLDVVLQTQGSAAVQAWELDLAAALPVAAPIGALPHPEFDDDGKLFSTLKVDLATARLSDVVDVRHGPARTGIFRIATIQVLTGTPGEVELQFVDGGLAGPDGSDLSVNLFPATLTVTP